MTKRTNFFYLLISAFLFLMSGCNHDDDVPNPYRELILGKWVAVEVVTQGGEHITLSSSSFIFFTQEYFSNGKCIITIPNRGLSEEYKYRIDSTSIFYYRIGDPPREVHIPYTLFDENKKLINWPILIFKEDILHPNAIDEFVSERKK